MKSRLLFKIALEISGTVLMVIAALLIGAILVVMSENSPAEAYRAMILGAFGSKQKITEVVVKLIPILIMASGVSVAFRAQLWNIGAGGQFLIGSIVSVAIALYLPGPLWLRVPLSFVAAVMAGAGWAALAGWLKTKFSANEVITTLMLNYIAHYLLLYLINGPMQDPYSDLPQTDVIPDGMRLAKIIGPTFRLHSGLFIMMAVVVLMIFFWKTALGYRIDLTGQGEKVATYAGIQVKKTIILTMAISGGLIGLAGWIEIFGIQFRLLDGIAGGLGNTATIVALLGSLNVYGIIAAAIFFAALLCGGASMKRMTEVPYSVVDVIQGLIIIFVIAKSVFSERSERFNIMRLMCKKEAGGHAE